MKKKTKPEQESSPLEDAYNARGAALKSTNLYSANVNKSTPSPSASTRFATANKRFQKEAAQDKKLNKILNSMTAAQRAGARELGE